MFINSRINFLSREDIKIDLDLVDILAIEIHKDELNTKYNIIIITLYRPPNIQINVFIDKLTDLLQFLRKENKYIFIVGDFNVDTYSTNTKYEIVYFNPLFTHSIPIVQSLTLVLQ